MESKAFADVEPERAAWSMSSGGALEMRPRALLSNTTRALTARARTPSGSAPHQIQKSKFGSPRLTARVTKPGKLKLPPSRTHPQRQPAHRGVRTNKRCQPHSWLSFRVSYKLARLCGAREFIPQYSQSLTRLCKSSTDKRVDRTVDFGRK
jgi:hypothetical protein